MGGCATKPKVFKGEEGEAPAPAPAPEPAKEEVAATAATNTVPSEAKDVVTEEGYYEKDRKSEDEKVDEAAAGNIIINNKEVIHKEIIEDEKVDGDDQESKPRSLSNLFKNEQGKESTADESGPSEAVKEETKEAEKPKLEAQNSEVPVTPESFVDATDKDDSIEKTIEAAPAITSEPKTAESSDQKTEAATESAEKIIQEDATESEEKKIEEAK